MRPFFHTVGPDLLRRHRTFTSLLAVGLLWSAGGAAWASDIAVPPLITRNISSAQSTNMTGLLASELDFLGEFDGVKEVSRKPANLNAKCLFSESCLGGVARSQGTQALLAGAVSYTHLTLPTLCSGELSVGAGPVKKKTNTQFRP